VVFYIRFIEWIWRYQLFIPGSSVTIRFLLELSKWFLDCAELAFENNAVLLFALQTRKVELIPIRTEVMETLQKKFQKQISSENESNSSASSELNL
jgi:hypothetical protein